MVNKTRKVKKVSGRFLTITMPDTLFSKDLYKNHIMPIIKKHKGTNSKCASAGKGGDFSESEHKFHSITSAKSAIKDLTKHLKDEKIPVGKKFGEEIIIVLMPPDYEETGSRGIVRPDYSYEPSIKFKKCKI